MLTDNQYNWNKLKFSGDKEEPNESPSLYCYYYY